VEAISSNRRVLGRSIWKQGIRFAVQDEQAERGKISHEFGDAPITAGAGWVHSKVWRGACRRTAHSSIKDILCMSVKIGLPLVILLVVYFISLNAYNIEKNINLDVIIFNNWNSRSNAHSLFSMENDLKDEKQFFESN
jgi:hypothetical protein